MPEPTDYHAEAEKWFGYATEDDFVDVPDMNDVIASALIGILAALLARSEPKTPTAIVKISPPVSEADIAALRAAIRRSGDQPPLSPSEG